MKTMKFPAGTFIEVDNMAGGRKVVMVAKDGVTFHDLLDTGAVTPLLIHPCMQPAALGSMASYVHEHGLMQAATLLRKHVRSTEDADGINDSLFTMRALWVLNKLMV